MDTNAMKARKAIKIIDTVIDKILTVLFLMVLFIGAYFTYDSWYVYNSASLDSIPGYVWNGAETLRELPQDAKAWLNVDGTKINCPIMQGETNNDYLNVNPYGEYSLTGSVFMDFANSPDFTDDYTLLYGHHMSDGYMFGALDSFLDEEYFNAHRKGTLTVRDGLESNIESGSSTKAKTVEEQISQDKHYKTIYKLNIFAVVETDANEKTVFDVRDEGDLLGYIKENAIIYRNPEGGRIIALTTCVTPTGMGRIAVFATIVEPEHVKGFDCYRTIDIR